MKKPIRTYRNKWNDRMVADFNELTVKIKNDDYYEKFKTKKEVWEKIYQIKETWKEQALEE